MPNWESYRGWVDERLSKLSPEQLAAVRGIVHHAYGAGTGADKNPESVKAWNDAITALENAGYSEQQANALLRVEYNVWKHPETDTANTLFTGTVPVNIQDLNSIGLLPGGTVDTAKAEEERKRQQDFIAALQQQAATGGGAWESALSQATQAAENQQQSLWQSNRGINAGQALTGMAMGKAAAEANAAQQGEKIRQETKQRAAGELSGIEAGTQSIDAAQAEAEAGAKQSLTEALSGQASRRMGQTFGIVGAVGQSMSNGGPVPGKAKVFGDSEANDTVPAMLSPGEIVIPRSVAQQPDAARKAAHFVAAVKAKGGAVNKADGGDVTAPDASVGSSLFYPGQAASTKTGALLETGPYQQARAQFLANLEANLAPSALGAGPSVVPSSIGVAIDQANAAAMQSGRHGVSPVALRELGIAGGRMAGHAAEMRGEEQRRAMETANQALLAQRQRDLQFAMAQQQAAWRNTAMNMGLSAAEQQAMLNMASGASQAAMAGAKAAGGKSRTPMEGDFQGPPPPAWEDPSGSEWAPYPGESASPSKLTEADGEGFAKGGMVKKRQADFLRAMRAHQ